MGWFWGDFGCLLIFLGGISELFLVIHFWGSVLELPAALGKIGNLADLDYFESKWDTVHTCTCTYEHCTILCSNESSGENKEQKERVFSGDKFSDLNISAFMVSHGKTTAQSYPVYIVHLHPSIKLNQGKSLPYLCWGEEVDVQG